MEVKLAVLFEPSYRANKHFASLVLSNTASLTSITGFEQHIQQLSYQHKLLFCLLPAVDPSISRFTINNIVQLSEEVTGASCSSCQSGCRSPQRLMCAVFAFLLNTLNILKIE